MHLFHRLQVHLGSTTPNTVHHVTVTNPYPWMNLGDRKIQLTTNTRRRATSLKNRRCRTNRAHPNGVDLRPHQHLSPNTHLQETRPRSCLLTLSIQKWAGYHSIWRKRRARGAVLAVWLCDSFWMDGLLVSFNLSLSDFAFWITKRMLLITLTLPVCPPLPLEPFPLEPSPLLEFLSCSAVNQLPTSSQVHHHFRHSFASRVKAYLFLVDLLHCRHSHGLSSFLLLLHANLCITRDPLIFVALFSILTQSLASLTSCTTAIFPHPYHSFTLESSIIPHIQYIIYCSSAVSLGLEGGFVFIHRNNTKMERKTSQRRLSAAALANCKLCS